MERRHAPLIALAALAAAGTLWYLLPFQPALLANFAVALAVLAVPLWRWLPADKYGRVAATWLVGGLIGAYFFGALVFAAGVLAAVGLAARRWLAVL